jgi:nucleotide-binding universal stress UspA family protein
MKKILVPCDFSEPSLQAFRFAAQIASASKGEIFLLNIVEVPVLHRSMLVPVQSYESAYIKRIKENANKNFEKMREKWGKGVKTNLVVQQGAVLPGIKKFIARKKIDLVVMGTHGATGFREYSIGSNAEKMVRTSTVPVIALKKAPTLKAVRDIVFPTNFNGGHKRFHSLVKLLQNFFKAKLHILYVNTPSNFISDRYTEPQGLEFVKQNKFKNCTLHIYNDVDEEDGIVHFSSRFKSKLVAMTTHGRKGLGHLLSGSVAEDVVNHIDCPIWTVAEA